MKTWLGARWQAFLGSFDPDEAAASSTPLSVVSASGTLALVFLVVNYLGRPSPVTDVMVFLSFIITVVSALHYIRHAGQIISEGG